MSILRFVDTGLGDKLIDLIGIAVLKDALRFRDAHIIFCNDLNHWWGSYDPVLFDCSNVTIIDTAASFKSHVRVGSDQHQDKIVSGTAGASFHPFKLYKMINQTGGKWTLKECCDRFLDQAFQIKPSSYVLDCIPPQISMCIGIHLRKGDKISSDNLRHGTSEDELQTIITNLKEYVLGAIKNGEDQFFLCSDDPEWRLDFESWILQNSGCVIRAGRPAEDKKFDGQHVVIDFFMLTRCKRILQGIGYSTFSMTASMVGAKPIVNFFQRADRDRSYFIHWWKPLLKLQCIPNHTTNPSMSAFDTGIKDLGLHDLPERDIDIDIDKYCQSSFQEHLLSVKLQTDSFCNSQAKSKLSHKES